jgi:hypothetical protein
MNSYAPSGREHASCVRSQTSGRHMPEAAHPRLIILFLGRKAKPRIFSPFSQLYHSRHPIYSRRLGRSALGRTEIELFAQIGHKRGMPGPSSDRVKLARINFNAQIDQELLKPRAFGFTIQ